ncbi:MAG: hypothetical protein ACI36Z_09275 [Alloprevotella sp.]
MLPKKIYLNYVHEDDFESGAEITWSKEVIGVAGCDMLNREYVDLSQIWHDKDEKPQYAKPIVYLTRNGRLGVFKNDRPRIDWDWFVYYKYHISKWAYAEDLIPKEVVKSWKCVMINVFRYDKRRTSRKSCQ